MTRDSVAPPSPELRELQSRLARVRGKFRNTAILTAASATLALIVVWLCLSCTLDYSLMLQWSLRALLLVATAAGVGLLVWALGVRPLRRSLKDDAVALMIERALPVFRSRYIAAVQLARGETEKKSLVRALLVETAALARTQPFHGVVDKRVFRRCSRLLLLAMVAGTGVGLWLGAEKIGPLVRRALLSMEPVPRRTKIEVLLERRTLAIGDDLLIAARAGGMIPREGRAILAYRGGRKQEIVLSADPQEQTRFSRTVRNLQESFDLTVYLGDARTEPIAIKAKPRPSVVTIEATEILPAYTGRKPEKRTMTSLKLLTGSRLALRVKTNTRVERGSFLLHGSDRDKPIGEAALTPVKRDPLLVEGEIPIPAGEVSGFALRLVDEDGVSSRSSTIYPIELIPDRAPEIKLLSPGGREELLTAGADLLISFEAKDDFGIAKARLYYAVDWIEGAKAQTIDFDLGQGAKPKELVRRFEWKTSQLRPALREGQVIDYWIEVTDANDVTGPGIATLDHYQVRIVTPLEKRAELAARLSDAMQGLSETRENQERLNQALGEFIFAKPAATP